MFLPISLFAAVCGAGLAAAATFLPDTGVDGTIGAYLALIGAVTTALLLLFLFINRVPVRVHTSTVAVVVAIAFLTGLAAWFLMQDLLVVAMVVSVLTLIAGTFATERQVTL